MPQDSLVCGMLHWCYCIRLSISHLDLFLPRDVMLARYLLSSCVRPFVRLSVCLSVTSRCYIETTGQIELLFSMKASFHLSHTVLGISRTIGLRKFRHLQVDHVVNKTRRRRRRSRLLTAPIRQSTSRGCLLQVGQQL